MNWEEANYFMRQNGGIVHADGSQNILWWNSRNRRFENPIIGLPFQADALGKYPYTKKIPLSQIMRLVEDGWELCVVFNNPALGTSLGNGKGRSLSIEKLLSATEWRIMSPPGEHLTDKQAGFWCCLGGTIRNGQPLCDSPVTFEGAIKWMQAGGKARPEGARGWLERLESTDRLYEVDTGLNAYFETKWFQSGWELMVDRTILEKI